MASSYDKHTHVAAGASPSIAAFEHGFAEARGAGLHGSGMQESSSGALQPTMSSTT
jgi:hypothetical protein